VPKKEKTPEQIILDRWGGVRNESDFFKSLSDDAYAGYLTGMTVSGHSNISLSVSEIYQLVYKLLPKL
jgi:hypothetical protein